MLVIIEAELIYRSDGSFVKVPASAYSARVRALEAEGCDTSDAQGIADAEFLAGVGAVYSVPLATISAPLCHDLGPSEPEDTEPAVFNEQIDDTLADKLAAARAESERLLAQLNANDAELRKSRALADAVRFVVHSHTTAPGSKPRKAAPKWAAHLIATLARLEVKP